MPHSVDYFFYLETGLCMFCLSMLCQSSQPLGNCVLKLANGEVLEQEAPSDT